MTTPTTNYFNRDQKLLGALRWTTLRTLGESRMVQSSFYWIFIVPVLAWSLHGIHSPIKLKVFGSEFPVNIQLPFSWYLFYFSALAFALGTLLYKIYCPTLISEFANFRDYLDKGGEGFRLGDEIEKGIPIEIIHDSPIWKAYLETTNRVGLATETLNGASDKFTVIKGLRKISSSELSSLFYTIQTVVDHSHPRMVRVAGLSFLAGILMLGVVLLQNLNAVFVQLLGGRPLITWPL